MQHPRLSLAAVILALAAACSSGPNSEQIEQTVVARITASAPASTPVPKDTPTPAPTNTPRRTNTPRPTSTPKPTPTPDFGTRKLPYPLGERVGLTFDDKLEFYVTITDIKRGNAAWSIIVAANQFNDRPPDGMEYMLARILVEYTGDDQGVLELDGKNWTVVTNGRIYDYFDWSKGICCLEPEFSIALFSGGKGEGLIAFPVGIDDPAPLFAMGGRDGIYFATTK